MEDNKVDEGDKREIARSKSIMNDQKRKNSIVIGGDGNLPGRLGWRRSSLPSINTSNQVHKNNNFDYDLRSGAISFKRKS